MMHKRRFIFSFPTFLGIFSFLLALWLAIDSLRSVFPALSPLPWFDDWETMKRFILWRTGQEGLLSSLLSQNNEHRILFPKMVFFFDDYYLNGKGRLPVILIFITQACQALIFTWAVEQCSIKSNIRWIVQGLIVSLMFSLRQVENFSSGFQLSFIGVFFVGNLSILTFSLQSHSSLSDRTKKASLIISLLGSFVAAFTLANGLLVSVIFIIMSIIARMRLYVSVISLMWGALVALVYFNDYHSYGTTANLADIVQHPMRMALYVVSYLGGIISYHFQVALLFGSFGVTLAFLSIWHISRKISLSYIDLALCGITMFCLITALITAYGRVSYGVEQSLQSRYATPSAIFWATQIAYWYRNNTFLSHKPVICFSGFLLFSCFLYYNLFASQAEFKPFIYSQYHRQTKATNMMAVGLEDPNVFDRVAWDVEVPHYLLPFMKDYGISIYAMPDVKAIGRLISERGDVVDSKECSGSITSVQEEPKYGKGAFFIQGQAQDGSKIVRRIFITDKSNIVVGLGSGFIQSDKRYAWEGYAIGTSKEMFDAYAMLSNRKLCRLNGSY